MTENLTESFRIWPWAPWLVLVGLCCVGELFRRDGWSAALGAGCLAAALVSVLTTSLVVPFGAFVVATAVALFLTKPWRPIADDADAAGR